MASLTCLKCGTVISRPRKPQLEQLIYISCGLSFFKKLDWTLHMEVWGSFQEQKGRNYKNTWGFKTCTPFLSHSTGQNTSQAQRKIKDWGKKTLLMGQEAKSHCKRVYIQGREDLSRSSLQIISPILFSLFFIFFVSLYAPFWILMTYLSVTNSLFKCI